MSPFMLKCLRESLGLTVTALAAATGQAYRTITRWEDDAHPPISERSAAALAELVAHTDRVVADLVATHPAGSTIIVYPDGKNTLPRDLAEYGGRRLSPAWYRAAAWRAAERTGAKIDSSHAGD
jgi:transcriptional regulator with XRE-family HTH domain